MCAATVPFPLEGLPTGQGGVDVGGSRGGGGAGKGPAAGGRGQERPISFINEHRPKGGGAGILSKLRQVVRFPHTAENINLAPPPNNMLPAQLSMSCCALSIVG